MRQYDATMLKYQVKIDERSVEEAINNKAIEKLQNQFKNVEEMYDEMRAMKRLKQLLQNMEKAEAIKQNWAARKIQVKVTEPKYMWAINMFHYLYAFMIYVLWLFCKIKIKC